MEGQHGQPGLHRINVGAYEKQEPSAVPPEYTSGGLQIQDGGMVQCGSVPTKANIGPNMATQVPDHMIFNLFMTIFCCWPIGIFAVIKSMASRDAKYQGDVEQATRLSGEARRLGFWTLGVGITSSAVLVILVIVMYAVFLSRVRYNL